VSPVLAITLGVLAAGVLPASIGALGAGNSWLQAVNPLALWQIVRALGLGLRRGSSPWCCSRRWACGCSTRAHCCRAGC
jgi:hypothetical protein